MTSQTPSDTFSIPKKTIRGIARAVGAIVVLGALIVLGGLAVHSATTQESLPTSIDSKTYQAVFLSNGQVFFGRLSQGAAGYYELRHVYFLQSSVTSRGRPGAQTLIKLTKEIQTPEDLILINRNQVEYVENLDPAGRAAKLLSIP
ncbi:MAG: hypothetical protein NVS2B16_08440 [Chloroflexota bacterium]